jgi:putative hydrolase of the HAD superfamily
MNAAINALIFDLDDTLVVEEASARAAFIQAGELARARHGIDPGELHATVRKVCRQLWYGFPSHPFCRRIGISSWEAMWAEFIGDDPEFKPLHEWAPVYRLESWRLALLDHGVDDPELAAELAGAFLRLRREMHVVYPEAAGILEKLHTKYVLGLLTNGVPDLQRRKLEGAGFAGCFKHALVSGEAGIGKPDRRVFEMLLDRMETSADRTLMIGDSLENDVQGAQGAGMRAVWVNRTGRVRDSHILPDWEIASLDQLIPILATV